MKPGEGWSSRWVQSGLGLLLWLLAGCAAQRPQLDQELRAAREPAPPGPALAESYLVGCPDVLELTVAGRPELNGMRNVGPDGRIDLGPLGRLRVEGRSVPVITGLVARVAAVAPEQVQVRVAVYKSQQVYLFGQVSGLQRTVPYCGQETVLDLLQRVGGVTPGAAAEDVYVVRARLLEGRPPEVFHIDLQGIVTGQDAHTNLQLLPQDQVYVGETRRSSLETYIPPWFRRTYERLCGLYRSKPSRPQAEKPAS